MKHLPVRNVITFLHGRLAHALPTQATIDVNGVGYEVLHSALELRQTAGGGQAVEILTHLHVREDAHMLYGFMTAAERDLFRSARQSRQRDRAEAGAGGVERNEREQFQSGGGEFRCRGLSKISGLGKKTAERMVLELKDKVGVAAAWEAASAAHAPTPEQEQANEAVLALIALGYKQVDAHKTVRDLQDGEGAGKTAEELVKMALKKMAAGR